MINIKRVNINTISSIYGLKEEFTGLFVKPKLLYPILKHEPYRSTSYSIGLILSGEKTLNIGLESYTLSSPGLLIMGPDLIRQWADDGNQIDGMLLFFTEDFIISGLSNTFFIRESQIFAESGNNFINLTPALLTKFKAIFEQIELKNISNDLNKLDVICYYIRILLLEAEEAYRDKSNANKTTYTQPENISRKFKRLLEINYINHREVQFYADQLYISSKHLSQTLKDQTGKTASDWIYEIIILEAKVLLQNKENTIKQISDHLNFANPSFFGKFFKRNTSLSPKEYRKNKHITLNSDI